MFVEGCSERSGRGAARNKSQSLVTSAATKFYERRRRLENVECAALAQLIRGRRIQQKDTKIAKAVESHQRNNPEYHADH